MLCPNLTHTRTFLVVQWLRLHASTVGSKVLVPSWGTKIPHAVWQDQKGKKQTNFKWTEDLRRYFATEVIQVARHTKGCSKSVLIRETCKPKPQHHLTPAKMAIIVKTTSKCSQGCGEKGTLMLFVGM